MTRRQRMAKERFFSRKWLFNAGLGTAMAVSSLCSVPTTAASDGAPLVMGWIENVRVSPGDFVVKAKLDTGARTSSMDAQGLEIYDRDGDRWVRFTFSNNGGAAVVVDRPVVRVARIKDLTGPTQERPVIELGICMGSTYRITEITLFDRTGFNYRLLLGRNFLRAAQVQVDPSTTLTRRPNCARRSMR